MAEVKHTPGPKADVLIRLTNPESGYVSETVAKVTASDWHVIDSVICGSGHLYAAAPDLFEALRQLLGNAEIARYHLYATDEAALAGSALFDTIQQARAALSKATAQQEGR